MRTAPSVPSTAQGGSAEERIPLRSSMSPSVSRALVSIDLHLSSILIVGAKNSGKTSFINFLRTSLSPPNNKRQQTPSPPRTALHTDSPFTFEYLETELENERIGV